MRSRNPRLCGYPRCLRTNRLAFWEDLFCTGRAPSSLPFRGSCPESTCGQSRTQTTTKGRKTLATTHVDKVRAWVDPTGYPTETQQKHTCLRILAQSQKNSSDQAARSYVKAVGH
jgi:hypothetical protein